MTVNRTAANEIEILAFELKIQDTCVCVCVYIHIYIHTHKHIYIYVYTHMYNVRSGINPKKNNTIG